MAAGTRLTVPGAEGVYTGAGWRGTGYKFAPWVGLVLARLALRQDTGYDIRRFAPARFAGVAGGGLRPVGRGGPPPRENCGPPRQGGREPAAGGALS